MNSLFRSSFLSLCLLAPAAPALLAQDDDAPDTPKAAPKSASEIQAGKLLDEAKAKIMAMQSLVVDFERAPTGASTKYFDRTGEITLERPNRFRIDSIEGAMVEKHTLVAVVSDGTKVTRMDDHDFIAYEKPVRAGSFFLGQNFIVQFFFDSRPIRFDPTDATWGRPVSLFDTNSSAYDRDVKLAYLGKRTLENVVYDVVEIKYNTEKSDIRQQISLDPDRFICQVDTYYDGMIFPQKFRHFRPNATLAADTWTVTKEAKMPLVESDPIRMGAAAPDFKLPGAKGEPEIVLKELLAKGKGVMICTLDGAAAKASGNADTHLKQMQVLQELKDKFEKQGLQIVCVVGGPSITPDLKDEMLLNWMPDLSRFNYPIAIDIDLERGIQGSAYENFHLNGRNNILLNKDGNVVFACENFGDKVNQLALYQALAQIGFTVSAADLDSAAK